MYYIRYFWVTPDEFFQSYVQKAATSAFMAEMVLLVPFLFLCCFIYSPARAVPAAFGLSFAAAVLVFSAVLMVFEWKERKAAQND